MLALYATRFHVEFASRIRMVVAKMRFVVLLFLCAHSYDAVIIRIKPARMLAYRQNQTTAVGTITSHTTAKGFAATTATSASTAATTQRNNPSIDGTGNAGAQFITITSDPSQTSTGATDRPKTTLTALAATAIGAATIRSLPATSGTPTVSAPITRWSSDATNGAPSFATNATNATAATIATVVQQTLTTAIWAGPSDTTESAKTSATGPSPAVATANLADRTGYFSVDPRTHLFYWFVRSQSKPTDPLVIWLQGQPNASSLYGAFDETGPFYIDARNKSIRKREHSWTSSFHVLYLDPHPGCGFSYSDDPRPYSLDYDRVATTILRALRHFYATYPQLAANDLYLAAQSVGAKYAIAVAHGILRTEADRRPNLKGVLLGNPVIDEYQLANYHFGMFTFGLVDLKTMKAVAEHEERIAALIRANELHGAAQYWHQHVFRVYTQVGYRSVYDVRSVNAFWDSLVVNHTNQANVRKALGVGDLKFKPAPRVYVTGETLRPMPNLIRELLRNIKVLLYHGQYDMFAPYTHSTEFLNKLNWPENLDFYISQRHNWYIGKRLVGYWSNSHNLSLLLIRNAGHMVGSTQPECMLQMLNDFTNAKFEGSIQFSYQNSTT